MTIVVIGAGLAGLSAARALRDAGAGEVTVVERREGPGLETSFANGALLHPSLVEPWNSPGVIGSLLRNLGNEEAAALLRMRAVPSLIGWGWRFMRESSPDKFLCNTRANLALARYSVSLMPALRASGLAYGHRPSGSLVLYRDLKAQTSALAWAQRLSGDGLRCRVLGVDEALAREPALAPIARDLVGAIHNEDDEGGDAHLYCTALAAQLAAAGVVLRFGEEVRGVETKLGRVAGLSLANGESLRADAVVMAAASHSSELLRAAGLALPVRPAKGYSVTWPLNTAPADLRLPGVPVIDPALHVAVVPVGADRLRVAGTAEFCGFDLSISQGRVDNLRRQLARVYPSIASSIPAAATSVWAGLRPMTPDGVPLIGATRIKGLFLNTGHGHLGWTLAAGSARVLADLMLGKAPDIDAVRYSPARFGLT